MAKEYQTIQRTFGPVYNASSRILILGSFPSVRSREAGFYYGHPRNRFWQVLAALFDSPVPDSVEERRAFVLERRIALWDVIERCDIIGSSDSSIRNVLPVDLPSVVSQTQLRRVFCNGALSYRLFRQWLEPSVPLPVTALPSTSPANAAWSFDRLLDEWRQILPELALEGNDSFFATKTTSIC